MRLFILLAVIALGSCKTAPNEKTYSSVEVGDVQEYDLVHEGDTLSSRAVVTYFERAVFGLSHGLLGYAGGDRMLFTLRDTNNNEQFRSMALIDDRKNGGAKRRIYFINAGSPAVFRKTMDKPGPVEVVYEDTDSLAFYNTLKFWDNENGIVTGDQQDGCLTILTTKDGGETWNRVPCENLPDFEEGEANFAASNTCIDVVGDNAWIVTGGKKARVLHTPDKGKTWKAYETPIVQGSQMTGIFSVDFWDENLGVIFGGDWENQDQNTGNKAITKDGGKTWQLLADGSGPGYRSCVKFHPKGNGQVLIACGSKGVEYSMDQGQTWDKLIDGGYYTMDFSPSGDVLWLAGRGKAARVELALK